MLGAAQFRGQITDSSGSDGIEGAVVELDQQPGDGTPEYQRSTDMFGFYRMPDVAAGTYDVTVSHPAHNDATDLVELLGNSAEVTNYALDPLDDRAVYSDLYIQVAGVKTGLAIAGTPVLVERYASASDPDVSDTFSGHTDENGNLIFRGIREGFFLFHFNQIGQATPPVPGWLAYSTPERQEIRQPHTVRMLLKPTEQSLTLAAEGFNPVTESVEFLQQVYVELEGVDPNDPNNVVLDARTGITDVTSGSQSTETFSKLPPINYNITAKRLGYTPGTLQVSPDASAVLPSATQFIPVTLNPTVLNVALSSPYPEASMLDGVTVKIEGLEGTNTEGIMREVDAVMVDDVPIASFTQILPGRYRVTVEDVVEVQTDIRIGGLPAPRSRSSSFTVRFQAEDYLEAADGVEIQASLPLRPVPVTLRGKLLTGEDWEETDGKGAFTTVYLPRAENGLEVVASAYLQGNIPADFATVAFDTDANGEFALTLVPGLYGIKIPSMPGYAGNFAQLIEKNNGTFGDFIGWPYADAYPYSNASAQAAFYIEVGGFALSSGEDVFIELFSVENKYRLDGLMDANNDPTASRLVYVGIDSETQEFESAGFPYSLFDAQGGRMTLSGPSNFSVPTLQVGPESTRYFSFLNIPPGNYTLGMDSTLYSTGTSPTFSFPEFPSPGEYPTTEPASDFSTPSPMAGPFANVLANTSRGTVSFILRRWVEVDPEIGPSFYDNESLVEETVPEFFQSSLANGLTFDYLQSSQLPATGSWEAWFDVSTSMPPDFAHVEYVKIASSESGAVIYVGGPQDNISQFKADLPEVSYDLSIEVFNNANQHTRDFDPVTNPVTINFPGSVSRVPGVYANATGTFVPESVDVNGWSWPGPGNGLEASFGDGVLNLKVFLDKFIRIKAGVQNELSLPVPGAAVRFLRHHGNNSSSLFRTNANGEVEQNFGVYPNTTFFYEITARGYEPLRVKRGTEPNVVDPDGFSDSDRLIEVEAILKPLDPPEITPDSFTIDRKGLFLVGVNQGGDKGLFERSASVEEALTATWTIRAENRELSFPLPRYLDIAGSPNSSDETLIYRDAIKEVWLIDRRAFPENPYTDPKSFVPLYTPDLASPHDWHKFLADLENGLNPNTGTAANIFYQKITEFSETGTVDEVEASGQLPLWKLPPDTPTFLAVVVSERGAINALPLSFSTSDQLTGVKLPPWLAFMTDIMSTVAGAQKTVDDMPDFIPKGKFEALPEFTASITEDEAHEQFLLYDYNMMVDWNESADNLGSEMASIGPGALGLNFKSRASFLASGFDRELNLSIEGDISGELINLEDYKPKFLRKLGEVSFKADAGGYGKTSATKQINTYSVDGLTPSNDLLLKTKVAGWVDGSGSIDVTDFLEKLPTIGPALAVTKEWTDLSAKMTTRGAVGLSTESTFSTDAPLFESEDQVERRNMFGGNEGVPMIEPLGGDARNPAIDMTTYLDFGLSLSLGERAGATGTVALTGEEGTVPVGLEGETLPGLNFRFNDRPDWPLILGYDGEMAGEITAKLDVWVAEYEKTWKWLSLPIKADFTTDPFFALVPMEIVTRVNTLGALDAATFQGDQLIKVDDFPTMGRFALSPGAASAMVYTDAGTGGSMALRFTAREPSGDYSAPALIVESDGAIVSQAIVETATGFLAVWSEIPAAVEQNPYANSFLRFSTSSDGATWASPQDIQSFDGVVTEIHPVDFGSDFGLLVLESNGGPQSAAVNLYGTTYNSSSWSSVSQLLAETTMLDFAAMGNRSTISPLGLVAWIDEMNALQMAQWSGGNTLGSQQALSQNVGSWVDGSFGGGDVFYLLYGSAAAGAELVSYDSVSQTKTALGNVGTSGVTVAGAVEHFELSPNPLLALAWVEDGVETTLWSEMRETDGTVFVDAGVVAPFDLGRYSNPGIQKTGVSAGLIWARHSDVRDSIRVFSFDAFTGILDDDFDQDSLADRAELTIVDAAARLGSSIGVASVPGADDFDADTISNAEEITEVSNPVNANSVPQTLPRLTIDSLRNEVTEGEPEVNVFLITSNRVVDSDLTVNYSVSGDAIPGVDYAALPGQATISSGGSTVAIPIETLEDGLTKLPETITVTLGSDHSYRLAASTSASSNVVGNALDKFRVAAFPTDFSNESVAGDLADFDGDGFNTILEFTFGGNASSADLPFSPEAQLLEIDGETYLGLTYTFINDLGDLEIIGQISDTLGSWRSGSAALVLVNSVDNGDGTTTATIRDIEPFDENAHRFIRLLITR